MKEIERIIKEQIELNVNAKAPLESGIAEAIEQYVIKARIEELDRIPLIRMSFKDDTGYVINQKKMDERIAELKKLSKPCLCYNDQFNSECPRHN